MRANIVWNESKVREHRDVQRDASIKDALFGRIFGILGVKHSEMGLEHHKRKANIVFQGNTVRSKSGVRPVELHEEVANTPASFATARCALAAAALTNQEATLRYAEQAFLQPRIEGPDRAPTWVEVPRKRWPTTWFEDEGRGKP